MNTKPRDYLSGRCEVGKSYEMNGPGRPMEAIAKANQAQANKFASMIAPLVYTADYIVWRK